MAFPPSGEDTIAGHCICVTLFIEPRTGKLGPSALVRIWKIYMAFGYEYLMVYLPEICPSSFLLFVHNPGGLTKLRDYSSGQERQLRDTLTVAEVLSRTTIGRTRCHYDPQRTNGKGVGYWTQVTRELNRRWLSPVCSQKLLGLSNQ